METIIKYGNIDERVDTKTTARWKLQLNMANPTVDTNPTAKWRLQLNMANPTV